MENKETNYLQDMHIISVTFSEACLQAVSAHTSISRINPQIIKDNNLDKDYLIKRYDLNSESVCRSALEAINCNSWRKEAQKHCNNFRDDWESFDKRALSILMTLDAYQLAYAHCALNGFHNNRIRIDLEFCEMFLVKNIKHFEGCEAYAKDLEAKLDPNLNTKHHSILKTYDKFAYLIRYCELRYHNDF